MVTLRNPEVPETSRQRSTPFNYAHITFITGEQGSGKSVTAVARIRDINDRECVRIYCEKLLKIKCLVSWYNRGTRIAKIKYNKTYKKIRIPATYHLQSDLKIFCNFHLYGIKYYFIPSFNYLVKWLEDGTITEGYLIVDEYYMGGFARESMSVITRRLAQLSQQYRKRQLEVMVMCPLARLADWTMRISPTEHISCSFDERTNMVSLEIRKRGIRGLKKVSFDASQYFHNYWTNEIINS